MPKRSSKQELTDSLEEESQHALELLRSAQAAGTFHTIEGWARLPEGERISPATLMRLCIQSRGVRFNGTPVKGEYPSSSLVQFDEPLEASPPEGNETPKRSRRRKASAPRPAPPSQVPLGRDPESVPINLFAIKQEYRAALQREQSHRKGPSKN